MKVIIVVLVCLFSIIGSEAQQLKEKFAVEMDYLTYRPVEYAKDSIKKWPLVIFLHGAGERGTDIEKIKVHGPPMRIENGTEFPFILISPQAEGGWDSEFLYKMIIDFIDKNNVDKDRVYLTGLSMGGYGTWNLGIKHPEMFAAIAPICGGGDPKGIWKLRHMPVWCFHGKKDEIVPISASENMVNALKEYNSNVKFTIYPEVYHDSWIKTYNNPEFYKWLLSQRKHKFKAINLITDQLTEYTGKYDYNMRGEEGILNVSIEEGSLIIDLKSRKTTLIPFEENKFFIHEDQPVEFQFLKDGNGELNSIRLYTNEVFIFNKVK